MSRSTHGLFAGALLLALLGGCASAVPPAIRAANPQGVSMAEARARGAAAVGARVRWGGRILSVENKAEATWLEVLALALGTDGEPDREAPSEGRFLARVAGFLDPAVYAPDRLITLVGVLDKPATRPVGEYPYVYPRLNVDVYYLWPPPVPAPRPDPWCDPWAPLNGYPFGWGGPWPDCRRRQ